jgi:hypothetical protein
LTEAARKKLKLIVVILGVVGIVNILLLGIYVTDYLLLLALFSDSFFLESNIIKVVAGGSIALIIIGLFLVLKNHSLSGGISIIITTAIMVAVYAYYSLYFTILKDFNPSGYLLLLPAPISGAVAILISHLDQKRQSPKNLPPTAQ